MADAGTSGQVNLPNQGQVTTAEESPQEKGGAMQSWLNTAQAPPAAKPQTESMPAGAAAPQVSAQPQALKTVPVPITSLKPGGIKGLMDSMLDVFAGTQRPELGKDPDGNVYIKQHTLTRGQQWMKIAGEAFTGAAAGLAAGKGAGNQGKAMFAGMQAQQQQTQNQTAEMRQTVLDSANAQMLKMKMAEQAWTATRNKIKATEEDVRYMNEQEDRLTNPIEKGGGGGRVIGTAAHPGDIADILKTTPDVMNHLVKTGQLRILDNILPDGTRAGIKAILMPSNYGKNILPDGSIGHSFDPTTGQIKEFKYSDPVTENERDVHDIAAYAAKLDYDNKIKEQELKGAQKTNVESETKARDKELPGKIAETQASAAEKNAQAKHLNAETGQITNPTFGGGQTAAEQLAKVPPTLQNSLYGLADYSVNPDSFPTRTTAKSGQMDRETAIGLAKSINPSYDETQYKNRNKTRSDFGSGQARRTINSLNTAVDHLDRLRGSIAALNNSSFWLYNAGRNVLKKSTDDPTVNNFNTDANAVTSEMAQVFKGTGATDQEINAWRNSLSAAAGPDTLTDAANEMLRLMAGRLNAINDQWTSSMGDTRDFHILSPHSQEILQKMGANDLINADTTGTRPSYRQAVPPAAPAAAAPGGGAAAPQRPPNVPPNAVWNGQANNGKGAWTL